MKNIWSYDNTTQWKNSNVRAELLNRMWIFTEFWYNRWMHPLGTGNRIVWNWNKPIRRFIFVDGDDNTNINRSFDFEDFNSDPNGEDMQILKRNVIHCFDKRFLPFLRDKCREEGSI